jgi:hypothetical protein
MSSPEPSEATRALALWQQGGGDAAGLEQAALSGADPVLPGRFKVATAALASIGAEAPEQRLEDIDDLLITSNTPFGRVRHVAPAERLSATPARWARPTVPLGTDAPTWADA